MSETETQLQTVNVTIDEGVATIELNRPQTLNAWNAQFGADLMAALERCREDEEVRSVLITGAGRGFSSGADLRELGGGAATPEERPDAVYRQLTEIYHPIMVGIRELPKPVVAAVNGPAVGIGCSLALCCDLIVAAESAYFLLAFVNIGLVPDGGSSVWLPTRIGMARATELCMLGERLPAAAGTRVGPDQPRGGRQFAARGGRSAGREARGRPDAVLRGHQAPAEQLAVRADGRAARPRGADPAGDGGQRGLGRGGDRVRRKAARPFPGPVTPRLVANVIKRLRSGPE